MCIVASDGVFLLHEMVAAQVYDMWGVLLLDSEMVAEQLMMELQGGSVTVV